MKVSLFGLGRVGTNLSFLLAQTDYISELNLFNRTEEKARGIALDLNHSTYILGNKVIRGFSLEDLTKLKNSDLIIFAIGSQRKAGQKRVDVSETNVKLCNKLFEKVNDINSNAIYLIITNPVDIITHLANQIFDTSPKRIIGLGTLIDTVRYRSLYGQNLGINSSNVTGMIIGEHGQDMLLLEESMTLNGVKTEHSSDIFFDTKGAGGEVIELIKGPFYTASLSAIMVIKTIFYDEKSILPLSSELEYDTIGNVALSLPVILGKNGIEKVLFDELTSKAKDDFIDIVKKQLKKQDKLI